MRGGVRGLEASALIDGDVHHHGARLHGFQHLAPHQLGRRRARNQHRAYHQIGMAYRIADSEYVGCQRHHLAAVDVVQRAQAIETAIDDGDGRAQSTAILAELWPTTPPPRITTLAGATPGTPPSRMPRPPLGRSRYTAPTCTAMRPATSLMGVSSGSEPSASRMVSYADRVDLGVHQLAGQFGQRSQMQIGEQDQAGAEVRIFGRLRLLHLDDEIGLAPNLGGAGKDLGARVDIFAVGDGTAGAGLGFDEHAMAGFTQRRLRRSEPTRRAFRDL